MLEAIVVKSIQRNLMWPLLKFHFDDIYFAHVVFYLQEDEIDADGHMCRKPEETCLNFFFDMRMNIFLASLCLQFKVEWYQRE